MFFLLVILPVLTTAKFHAKMCDGHHHQKKYWNRDMPTEPNDWTELYRNKCLFAGNTETRTNAEERQYVEFFHDQIFDFEKHTAVNSFVDVFYDPDYAKIESDCAALEADGIATCSLPVDDVTQTINEARGTKPKSFVLSYTLPERCEQCASRVVLNIDEKKHHRILSTHNSTNNSTNNSSEEFYFTFEKKEDNFEGKDLFVVSVTVSSLIFFGLLLLCVNFFVFGEKK